MTTGGDIRQFARHSALVALSCAVLFAPPDQTRAETAVYPEGFGPAPALPAPSPPIGLRGPRIIGWAEGRAPIAPPKFAVRAFAKDIESPRWLHVLPNGDVLAAQSAFSRDIFGDTEPSPENLDSLRQAGLLRPSPNRIILMRDEDGDGAADLRETFIEGLDHPFGMALVGDWFYVAATDALWRFPYATGQTRMISPGEKILDLPAGQPNPHWTRNVVAHPDGTKLYVAIGSATNVDEEGLDRQDQRRAAILEFGLDGANARVFASGLRNPVGMDWAPGSAELWAVVNERDHLGPDLPPDFLTRVRDNGFYGWPVAYFGPNEDPVHAGKAEGKAARALRPDYALAAHTAPLGLVFQKNDWPEPFREGAFISQHGSMRRHDLAGYKVIFVPFQHGRPIGPPIDVLTGFIASQTTREALGRPAGLAFAANGGLLVADDAGDCIWLVEPK